MEEVSTELLQCHSYLWVCCCCSILYISFKTDYLWWVAKALSFFLFSIYTSFRRAPVFQRRSHANILLVFPINITWSFWNPVTKLSSSVCVIPFEIRRFKFTMSWLCDDHIAAGTFVVKGPRHRAMTATSPRCRRTTLFKDKRNIDCLPQVCRRFVNGNGCRPKEQVNVSNVPSSHSLIAAVFCVETAHPSSFMFR
jgi:hypothetical protein